MPAYIPNTQVQQNRMLDEMGLTGIQDLFAGIPETIRLKRELNLPEPLSEMELKTQLRHLAEKNCHTEEYALFLGAGAYDHYIPSVVSHLTSRQEFYTAYTPYQPEVSQGTLQAIFEYQTMICRLTGMDVANASMYDGASALAEAAVMACQATKRREVLAVKTVHPESRKVVSTYLRFKGSRMIEVNDRDGITDPAHLEELLSEDTAAVIVQTPNFFGLLEKLEDLAEQVHRNGSLLIAVCDPIALAILKPPGEAGADIAVGEGQSLGNPLSFGGPYLGFFAAKKELTRRMPGRIVGQTTDKEGRRGFVLTIQTREQHIRREKATSNICSNQALNALTATIYLASLGKEGLRKAALLCTQKAHYAYKKLIETGAFSPVFTSPFFKEFILKFHGNVEQLNKSLLAEKIIGGYPAGRDYPELENTWLVAVTEKRTKEEIDQLAGKAALVC